MAESSFGCCLRRCLLRLFHLPITPDPVPVLIPDELIWEILTRLPVKSLMRFKCVSRSWLSMITDPSFAMADRGGIGSILVCEPFFHKLSLQRCYYCVSHRPTLSLPHGGSRRQEDGSHRSCEGPCMFLLSELFMVVQHRNPRKPGTSCFNERLFSIFFPNFGRLFVQHLKCEILTLGVDSTWRIIDNENQFSKHMLRWSSLLEGTS